MGCWERGGGEMGVGGTLGWELGNLGGEGSEIMGLRERKKPNKIAYIDGHERVLLLEVSIWLVLIYLNFFY